MLLQTKSGQNKVCLEFVLGVRNSLPKLTLWKSSVCRVNNSELQLVCADDVIGRHAWRLYLLSHGNLFHFFSIKRPWVNMKKLELLYNRKSCTSNETRQTLFLMLNAVKLLDFKYILYDFRTPNCRAHANISTVLWSNALLMLFLMLAIFSLFFFCMFILLLRGKRAA